ncbi:PIN domain-containing protein [Candidatus Woesearchaeota archaeon]|nr:PIN domain-containing protein [Candidatus Woesearchaeota archaeon]
MVVLSFYVDSCIYLNLWQKEEVNGIPFWRFAKEFFEKYNSENFIIYYSGFLLKELTFILSESEFEEKRSLFAYSRNFKKIILSREEFDQARKIESEEKYEISFYDIIHMLLAKKTNSILITRDSKLLITAKKYSVEAKKPEELL